MLGLAGWAGGSSAPALAQPGETRVAPPRVDVVVHTERDPSLVSATKGALAAHFADVPVELHLVAAADDALVTAPLARLSFEVTEVGVEVRIDGGGAPAVSRNVVFGDHGKLVAVEVAVLVARDAVLTMLERPTASAEPEPTRAGEDALPPVADAQNRHRLRLSVGYLGTNYARRPIWSSGATLDAAFVLSPGVVIGAGYEVFLPLQRTRGGVVADVRRHPVRATVGGSWSFGRVSFGFEALGVFDYVTRRASASADVRRSPRGAAWSVALGSGGRLAVRPWRSERAALFLWAGAGTVLRPQRWIADVPERIVVQAESRVRATVIAGVDVFAWISGSRSGTSR